MKNLNGTILLIACLCMTACSAGRRMGDGSKNVGIKPVDLQQGEEILLWASAKERPDWLDASVEQDEKFFVFVGASEAAESREPAEIEAINNAADRASRYLNVFMEDGFKKIAEEAGLSEIPPDAQATIAKISELISTEEFYCERRLTSAGNSWNVYVLAKISTEAINKTISALADQKYSQADSEGGVDTSVQKFWRRLKEEGITGKP